MKYELGMMRAITAYHEIRQVIVQTKVQQIDSYLKELGF